MIISLYQTLKTTQKSVDKCPTSFGAFVPLSDSGALLNREKLSSFLSLDAFKQLWSREKGSYSVKCPPIPKPHRVEASPRQNPPVSVYGQRY